MFAHYMCRLVIISEQPKLSTVRLNLDILCFDQQQCIACTIGPYTGYVYAYKLFALNYVNSTFYMNNLFTFLQ